jgi:hypothetical protein
MAIDENIKVCKLIFNPQFDTISTELNLPSLFSYDNEHVPLIDFRGNKKTSDFGIVICTVNSEKRALAVSKTDRIFDIRMKHSHSNDYILTDMSFELIHYSRLLNSELDLKITLSSHASVFDNHLTGDTKLSNYFY